MKQYVTGGGCRASAEWGIPGELHITSLSRALLAGSKPRVGLTFTGAAGWRSSAVDGGLGHLGPTLCLSSPPNPGDTQLHKLDEPSPTRLVCLGEVSAREAAAHNATSRATPPH
jgi:hypothetical protein